MSRTSTAAALAKRPASRPRLPEAGAVAETAVVALARPAAVCPACRALLDGGPVVFWCPGCRRGLHAADLDVDFRAGVPW